MSEVRRDGSGRLLLWDGMTWPNPWAVGHVAWMMRHCPEGVTDQHRLLAASVIEAYIALCAMPQRTAVKRLSVLKKAGQYKEPEEE